MSEWTAVGSAPLPECVLRLLWDVDKTAVDIERHARFLIARVLDYGDVESVNWLRRTFGDDGIRDAIESGIRLFPKTVTFWRTLLHCTAREARVS